MADELKLCTAVAPRVMIRNSSSNSIAEFSAASPH
jgi:hypothetical protein